MKIIIIGDGKVGYKLARQLSTEKYDVVLIDSDEKKLRFATDHLDIACVAGNGADAEVLKQADIAHADLAIACTSEDECNMLSCLIARKLGARHTIARVRNPIYYRQIGLLKEDLHLSMAVNPELIVADEISRLLIFPDASQIETFVKGRMELLELPVSANGVLEGMRLSDMYRKFQIRLLVCAVERGEDVRIPDGEYVLKAGDRLHIAASHKDLERFFKANGKRREKIKKVIICGGGRVGYYLAAQLSTLGMQVKIIEENARRCEELCELLPKATIINGDATDHDLLVEEGVEEADAFVALTGMDEENIILSLYAKSQNVDKIVAKVNEDRRARMVEEFGIDSIVSVKTATADAIMSYVRARKNSQASANIETMYQLVDDKVEALEFIIKSATEYTGIPLKDLALKPNNLIVCIGRKRQIILPSGEDCIEVGDSVVVITMEKHIEDILKHMQTGTPFSETELSVYKKLFLEYCVLGGMPAVVKVYIEKNLFTDTLEIQRQIQMDYEEDIRKYAEGLDQTKIVSVYRNVPVQLAKENKKFQLSKIDKKARSREYMGCITWLEDAGVISVCYCLQYPELPLKGNYDDSKFKIYYPDTGLLIASLDEEAQEDLRANKNLGVYKGALYENFVAEAFVKQGLGLYYYKKENATLEEDFFVRTKDELVPVEVKANRNRSKSLRQLISGDSYGDIHWGIKLADSNIGIEDGIYTFPYFCTFLLKRYLKGK